MYKTFLQYQIIRPQTKFQGYIGIILVCSSVRLSVQIRVLSVTFFCFDIVNHIRHIGELQWYDVPRTFMTSVRLVSLTLTSNLLAFFYTASCQTRNSCLLWHQHIIFAIWAFYHVTTCRVHSWSRDDVDFWPQGNISSVFGLQLFCPVTYM